MSEYSFVGIFFKDSSATCRYLTLSGDVDGAVLRKTNIATVIEPDCLVRHRL